MGGSEIILNIDELIDHAVYPSRKIIQEVSMCKDGRLLIDLQGKEMKMGLDLEEDEALVVYAVLHEHFQNHSEFDICSECYGSGMIDNRAGYRVIKCGACDGIGKIYKKDQTEDSD